MLGTRIVGYAAGGAALRGDKLLAGPVVGQSQQIQIDDFHCTFSFPIIIPATQYGGDTQTYGALIYQSTIRAVFRLK